jgi:hypothetical protein
LDARSRFAITIGYIKIILLQFYNSLKHTIIYLFDTFLKLLDKNASGLLPPPLILSFLPLSMAADEQREAKLAAVHAPCHARTALARPRPRRDVSLLRASALWRGGEEAPVVEKGRGGGEESAAVEEGMRGFGVSRGGKGRKLRRS